MGEMEGSENCWEGVERDVCGCGTCSSATSVCVCVLSSKQLNITFDIYESGLQARPHNRTKLNLSLSLSGTAFDFHLCFPSMYSSTRLQYCKR